MLCCNRLGCRGSIMLRYRPQLRGLDDIPKSTQEYAALDAWATLLAWVHLSHDGPEDTKPAWSRVRIGGI